MSFRERVLNTLFGLSVCAWGGLGLWHAAPDDRWTIARIGIALVNLATGALILFRAPIVRDGGAWGVLAAAPSMLAAGWMMKSMAAPSTWPWAASGIFAVGTLCTLWAFATLGRSFDLFPSRIALVESGPYAVLRHPAYAGEMLLLVACCVAQPSWQMLFPLALLLPLIAWRIHAEEEILCHDPAYEAYCRRVPWRLVPGVW